MPSILPIILECPKTTRFAGDTVTGIVHFYPDVAAEKDVTVVRVALQIDLRTYIRIEYGEGSHVYKDNRSLLKIDRVLWTPETSAAFTPGSSIPFPFSFQIPSDPNPDETSLLTWPPSMRFGNVQQGASIQYNIHAVAERKSWFQRNIRADAPFPFLPFDRTGAPDLDFSNWRGPWKEENTATTVRSNVINIFSGSGVVDVTVRIPNPASIPLFKPIPIILEVTCKSKLLPQSESTDVTNFKFPRNPPLSELEISLNSIYHIKAKKQARKRTEKSKLYMGDSEKGSHSGVDFRVESTDPVWIPDTMNGTKGRWVETRTFHCPVVFRCAPPFETPLLKCEVYLFLAINFPGLGNSWKTTIGPLNISSGVTPSRNWDGPPPELELPPTYWDIADDEDLEKGGEKDFKKEKK